MPDTAFVRTDEWSGPAAITPGAGRWNRLSEEGCARIQSAACTILERTGVRVDHPGGAAPAGGRGRTRGRSRPRPHPGPARGRGARRGAEVAHPARPVGPAGDRVGRRDRLVRARLGLPEHRGRANGRAPPGHARGCPGRHRPGGCPPEHGLRDVHLPALGRGWAGGGPPPGRRHADRDDEAADRRDLRAGRSARRAGDGRGRLRRRRRAGGAPVSRPGTSTSRAACSWTRMRSAGSSSSPSAACRPSGSRSPPAARRGRSRSPGRSPSTTPGCSRGSSSRSSSGRAPRSSCRVSAGMPWTCARRWTPTWGRTRRAPPRRWPTTWGSRCSAWAGAPIRRSSTARPPPRPPPPSWSTRSRRARSPTTAATWSRGSPGPWRSWSCATSW